MWESIKLCWREKWANFESLNGIVMLAWGAGFIYCGIYNQEFGYAYALVSVGVLIMFWGLRKVSVNRIKQAAVTAELVKARMNREAV